MMLSAAARNGGSLPVRCLSSVWKRASVSTAIRYLSGPSADGNQHVVVALGGNALLKRKQEMTIENQRKNIREGMESLKSILQKNAVTMAHGNGPVSFIVLCALTI